MNTRVKATIALVAVAAALVGAVVGSTIATATQTQADKSMGTTRGVSIVRDSQTLLMYGHDIPAGSYLHLYDATPYQIVEGHVAFKSQCDEDGKSPFVILTGQAPNVKPTELELVDELSKPGDECIYHLDLESTAGNPVTDIAVFNPTDQPLSFSRTSSIVIGVDEISPLEEAGH